MCLEVGVKDFGQDVPSMDQDVNKNAWKNLEFFTTTATNGKPQGIGYCLAYS